MYNIRVFIVHCIIDQNMFTSTGYISQCGNEVHHLQEGYDIH